MNSSKKCPTEQERQADMLQKVGAHQKRALKAQQQSRSIWFGLGAMGTIGWLVIIPILLGILIGSWLESVLISDFPWKLVLMLLGVITGCWNAWRWVAREYQQIEREKERKLADGK